MPLPGGATGFTLTGGPYDDPAFQGMAGKLTLSTPVTHVATGERVRKTWDFSIDYSGNFSVGPLPFSDDPAFTPIGFTYTITWQALSYKDTPGNLTFQVPRAAGSSVDFDTLFPALNGQSVPLGVFSVNGKQGAVTLSASDVGADAAGAASSVGTAVTTAAQSYTDSKVATEVTRADGKYVAGAGLDAAMTTVQGNASSAFTAAQRAALGLPVAATVTTAAALVVQKHNPVDATGGAKTMTLPTGAAAGSLLAVEKVDTSANAVTITGNMRGLAGQSITLLSQFEVRLFVADSVGSWRPIADHRTKSSLDSQYGPTAPAMLSALVPMFAPRAAGLRLHSPTQEAATFRAGTGANGPLPGWLSADGKRQFSYNESVLSDSLDGGASWRALHTFSVAHFVLGVREMPNGELLVSTSLDGATTTGGEIWVSAGYAAGVGGAAATWTKTLTMDTGANAVDWYSFSPPLHHHDDLPDGVNMGIVAVGEYGNKTTPNTSRKVYASEDYGLTWKTIYDPGAAVVDYHNHGVAYDPWGDAMWISIGDGSPNRSVRYSTNWRAATPTWTQIPVVTEQPSTIWPMPDCILLGSDNNPNGIHRVERTAAGAKYGPNLRTVFRLNTATTQQNLNRTIYKRPGGPLLFAFTAVRGSGETRGKIIGTWNGRDFYQLWNEPTPYVDTTYPLGDYGVYTAMGPTAQGKIVGHMRRDQPFWPNVEQAYSMPQPTWEISKAESQPYPAHVQVPVFQTPIDSALWNTTPLINPAHYYNQSVQATQQNAYLTWEILLGRGIYTIDVLHRTDTTMGNIHVLIDGIEVGFIDCYVAAAQAAKKSTITGVSVGSSGPKLVTVKILDKNASSSAYNVFLSGLAFTRTLELG